MTPFTISSLNRDIGLNPYCEGIVTEEDDDDNAAIMSEKCIRYIVNEKRVALNFLDRV